MTDQSSPGPLPARHRRDETIARLCEHFAADHLDAEELERLIDRAHAAVTVAELDALVAGLPALAEAGVTPAVRTADVALEASQTILAIMGGAERSGPWISSRRLSVFTLMGGAVLDFRDAIMPPGVTELEIYAMMGGVEILVPPGLRVISDGFGIMGGFEHRADPTAATPGANAPTLKITGFALMGGVEIAERLPGESAKAARKRQKKRLPPGSGSG